MHNDHPILVVSNADMPELEELGLDEDAKVTFAGESHALALIPQQSFTGLIVLVDGPGPLRTSCELVDSFLRHQPQGRIAVLSARNGDSTAGSLAWLPARVDVFFSPWDADAIKCFLDVPAPAVTG